MALMMNRTMLSLLTMLLVLLTVTSPQAQEQLQTDPVTGQLRQLLADRGQPAVLNVGGYGLTLVDETFSFYRQRDFAAAWTSRQALGEQGRRLLIILQAAQQEGLRPEEYHVKTIALLAEQLSIFHGQGISVEPLQLARLDILLTDAYLRYAGDVTGGRVEADKVYPKEWRNPPRNGNLVASLQSSLESDLAVKALQDMLPDDPEYRRLRDYLTTYRQLAAEGGWPQLPEGPLLKVGQKDWRVPWLQQRLIQTGDLKAFDRPAEWGFDQPTADALARFQTRHDLKVDGRLGPETLAALNLSVEERIRQIEINLERWRWLPRDFGQRYLAVNIADFSLEVVEKGETVLAMPVVVGTDYRRTPVFSAKLRYLDFAPYWNVPYTILKEDKLPLIKKNLNFIASHHYEIVTQRDRLIQSIEPETVDWEGVTVETFPGMLRQKPGPWNALGQVKFMFPNKFHVYLHDTPSRHLFDRKRRSYSSGCIRVERPFDLALYLLQDQEGWDAQRIEEAMAADETLRVLLDDPLPVHILYRTAWVDGEGELQFRTDIYERDAALYTALRRHNRKAGVLVVCKSGTLE
jgi:murein L,D-transpeptidase YcbB/YkuD